MKTEFCRASKLVLSFGRREMSFEDFSERYDNFYYAAALDGHEGGAGFQEFLDQHRSLVEVHRGIQETLDLIYQPPSDSTMGLAGTGRITGDEAERRILRIATDPTVASRIVALGECSGA